MSAIRVNAMWRRGAGAWIAVVLLMLVGSRMRAQQGGGQEGAQGSTAPADTSRGQAVSVELDRVVAVVNGELILESDVDEEKRFIAFQPFHDARTAFQRDHAIQRLIDRTLIAQQASTQPGGEVSNKEVEEQLAALRKDIPACKQYHCETDAGWQKFVNDQGFSIEELTQRWKERMLVLRFIEIRFKAGIHISSDDIKAYYNQTLVPQYAQQKVTPPKLETISDRIQEILLQQQVGSLLVDWLTTLRAQVAP
jgi:peptidyl-prolyl cis-trans isomerase SurA